MPPSVAGSGFTVIPSTGQDAGPISCMLMRLPKAYLKSGMKLLSGPAMTMLSSIYTNFAKL